MTNSSGLTPYEQYYESAGLAEYEQVFQFNTELDAEVKIYADRMRGWAGLRAGHLSVLDIGCGLGTFTQKLLHTLFLEAEQDCKPVAAPAFTLDIVDINAGAFQAYADRLAATPGLALKLERTICKSWMDISRQELASSYDLIVANHCFYGLPCDAALVRSVTDLLAPGGLALFALASRTSDVYQMRREAGIRINTGEDLEAAISVVNCNYVRAVYESDFYYEPSESMFSNWLFASASIDAASRQTLLAKYTQAGTQMPFIVNRAMIHIVESEALPLKPE